MKIEDQINRILHINETPKRIISLVPSQTELLCDLGLQSSLVGVTKFCVHPHHIKKEVVIVGGTKQIHIDKIRGLRPDIILCNKEENTKDIVVACQSICNVHVSDIYNTNDSLELIKAYGAIFDSKETASQITDTIKEELVAFEDFIRDKPILKTAYFIWRAPWMVAANNTFVNYLLELNKFENVFEDKTRYPEVDLKEESQKREIDLVLLSSEPFPFKDLHKNEVQEYFTNATIKLVDGEMFSWYGSRLAKAFQYFKSLRLNLQNIQA
ncbi:ABC transporter substrate-binding protein [uncultured Algibacter sp.]|uniref:ABC transporter substrate-binding protein n=1 Tax=uncultured Algibacter sp. TaxID=298659 RepID=UPI00260BBF36|nr:helical backbone metal receptor [uncultured Algibacter sp.]